MRRGSTAIAMVPEWPRRTKIRLGAKPDQCGPIGIAHPQSPPPPGPFRRTPPMPDKLSDAAAVVEQVPMGIYYSPEHSNFYDARTHKGMGIPFWNKWRDQRGEFPQSAQEAMTPTPVQSSPGEVERLA